MSEEASFQTAELLRQVLEELRGIRKALETQEKGRKQKFPRGPKPGEHYDILVERLEALMDGQGTYYVTYSLLSLDPWFMKPTERDESGWIPGSGGGQNTPTQWNRLVNQTLLRTYPKFVAFKLRPEIPNDPLRITTKDRLHHALIMAYRGSPKGSKVMDGGELGLMPLFDFYKVDPNGKGCRVCHPTVDTSPSSSTRSDVKEETERETPSAPEASIPSLKSKCIERAAGVGNHALVNTLYPPY